MMSRNPPPAPYRPNATLPFHPPYPPPHVHGHGRGQGQHPSRGETDVSYSAYSPSPSSLSAHRRRLGHIRNWAFRTGTLPRRGPHGPTPNTSISMGLGSASWSDTDVGTGVSDSITDVGTVPTTVKGARGNVIDNGVEYAGPREKVDVRKAMSAKQGLQRQPSQVQAKEDMEPSELPYRQSSPRRDPAPVLDKADHTKRPQANPPTRQPSARAHPAAKADTSKPVLATATAGQSQKPPTMYTKPRANKPTPQLARAPTPSPPAVETRIVAGTPLVTSPETAGNHKPMSPLQLREAYLDSALNLPLDMLSQKDAARIGLAVPGQGQGLKAAKSTSSINSVLTTGRLASLVGVGNGRGERVSPSGGMKRVVSDSAALKAGAVRQQGSTSGVKQNGTPDALRAATTNGPEPVRQAKSNQSSKTVRPATATVPVAQDPPRSLGSAPALGRSATAPSKSNAIPTPRPAKIPAPQPFGPSLPTAENQISALGLDLGLPATILTKTTELISNPDTERPKPLPRAVTQLQPAPHRQLGALRRPALTPGNSTDNLANTLAIGRKSRDPSMTDLRLRFEPAMYPLPESKSSVERSPTEVHGPETKEEGKQLQQPIVKAKGGKKEAGGALMGASTPRVKKGDEAIGPFGQNAALQLGRALAGKSNVGAEPGAGGRTGSLLPAAAMEDRSSRSEIKAGPRPPLTRRSATVTQALNEPTLSTPMVSATNVNPALSPATPFSPQDIIITPPPLPALRLDTPHSNTNTRSPGPDRLHAHTHAHGDDDRVSFEVPNGTRGRLRVSLAWFKDRAARSQGQGLTTPSYAPPPLPPKGPRIDESRKYEKQRQQYRHRVDGRPPSPPSSPPSPARSPVPLQLHPNTGQPTYVPLDPYFSHTTLPTYRAPMLQPYQIGHPFAYPQPQAQGPPPPGLGPAWTSLPHLAHLQQQAHLGEGRGMGVRQMGSADSIDPPSGDSPRGQMMDLPQRGFGMGMPMGMGMGEGMQNGINPYSTRSLNHNPQTVANHEHQYGYDQAQHPGHGQAQSQYPAGGEEYGRNPYGHQGNDRPQSRWKRMFNTMNGNGGGNGNGNRVQNWQDQDHQEPYPFHPNGAGREGKVGNWIKGITPGRAPTAYGNANANGNGYTNGNGNGNGNRIFPSSLKKYNLAQSFWTRRKDNNGGGHELDHEHDHEGYHDDPFAHANGHTNEYHPNGPVYRNTYDIAPRNQRQGQGGGGGDGGLIDRFFSWPGRGTRNGNRDRGQQYREQGYYGANNTGYGEPNRDRGRARDTERERDRQRRKDAERRNARQTRKTPKGQEQRQGPGIGLGLKLGGWMNGLNGNGNGYDSRARKDEGRGRKLSTKKKEGGKWKDRLPDSGKRRKERDGGRTRGR